VRAAAGQLAEAHLAAVSLQRRSLGDLVLDPLVRLVGRDRLLDRQQPAERQAPHGSDAVALPVLAVAHALRAHAEQVAQVLVLGQVGEQPVGRLVEVAFSENRLHRAAPYSVDAPCRFCASCSAASVVSTWP
jgi:hypothetical protein